MRYVLLGLTLCLTLCLAASLPASAAGSGTALSLKGDRIYLVKGSKSTPLNQDAFPAQPIDDTAMRFLGVGEDTGKEYGVAAGLYIFDGDGASVAFAPTDAAEFAADVKFSPDGKILAMDAGTWLIRSWFFYSFPDMKPMGEAGYYQPEGKPGLIWAGNKGVLVSNMAAEGHGRSCGYDPCGPVSVDYYAFAAQKVTRLLPGTDLCDFSLTGLKEDGRTVTAQELCLQSPKAWETFPENEPTKDVTTTIP